jgi:hypothetical protein
MRHYSVPEEFDNSSNFLFDTYWSDLQQPENYTMDTILSEDRVLLNLILTGFTTLQNDLVEWYDEGELKGDNLANVSEIVGDAVSRRQKKPIDVQTRVAIQMAIRNDKTSRTAVYTKRARGIRILRSEFESASCMVQVGEVVRGEAEHLFRNAIAREVALSFPHPHRTAPIDATTLQKHLAAIYNYMGALTALSDRPVHQHHPFDF